MNNPKLYICLKYISSTDKFKFKVLTWNMSNQQVHMYKNIYNYVISIIWISLSTFSWRLTYITHATYN